MAFAKHVIIAALALVLFTATPARAADGLKIAVIDIDALINESDAGKSMQTQLNKKREEFQKEFAKREAELGEKEKSIVGKKGEMSVEQLAKERQAFESSLLETRKLFQQRRTALDKGISAAMKQLRGEIVKASAEVAEEKGYQAVLLRESVVIVEKELDITKQVLAKLNAKIKTIPVTVN